MSEVVLPTVGRIVHYTNAGSGNACAAIITAVHTDSNVSVAFFTETEVKFALHIDQGDGPNQWSWMPFQKDQQARLGLMEQTAKEGGQPAPTDADAPVVPLAPEDTATDSAVADSSITA